MYTISEISQWVYTELDCETPSKVQTYKRKYNSLDSYDIA